MPKASDAEKEQRIDLIVEKLLEGCSRSEIVRFGSSTWHITPRQIDDYMTWAWQRIREAADIRRPDLVARHMKRLDRVAVRAWAKDDLTSAMKAYDLQSKITGMEVAPAEQPPLLPIDAEERLRMLKDEQESVH